MVKKRFLSIFLLITVFCFSGLPPPLLAHADIGVDFQSYCESEGIDYMPSHQYKVLVSSLISGSDYDTAYHEATGSYKAGIFKVDLDKQNRTTDTNFTKTNLLDKIKSVLSFGKTVYDTASDLLKDETYGTNWNIEIPSAYELVGKTKFIYNSGVEELVTLGVSYTRYYDKLVGAYRNKCTIYGTRQLISGGGAGNAATDFTVSETAGFYPVPSSEAFMLGYGSATGIKCTWTDSAGVSQLTTTSGVYSDLGLTTLDGGVGSVVQYRLRFASLSRQAITYIKFSSYVEDKVCYTYNDNKVSVTNGIVYTLSDVATNHYSDYVQTNSQQQNVYSPSINYNNQFVGGTTINNNNYNDYGYSYDIDNNQWVTDQNWYNTWQQEWNNQQNYNYNNTYINIDVSGSVHTNPDNETFDPFKEVIPEPTYPTDPPDTQLPTQPPETVPPTQPPDTVPPVTQTVLPKYTLDMTAFSSDVEELKKQAGTVSIVKSFWLVDLTDTFLRDTGLFPVFIALFLLGVLGVLLWR